MNGWDEQVKFSNGRISEDWTYNQPSQRLARRALTPTATSPSADTSFGPMSPLSPLSPFTVRHILRKHKPLNKAAKPHKHTFAESIQMSTMLMEAEKLVNGLEDQLNKPETIFPDLQRMSKFQKI